MFPCAILRLRKRVMVSLILNLLLFMLDAHSFFARASLCCFHVSRKLVLPWQGVGSAGMVWLCSLKTGVEMMTDDWLIGVGGES